VARTVSLQIIMQYDSVIISRVRLLKHAVPLLRSVDRVFISLLLAMKL